MWGHTHSACACYFSRPDRRPKTDSRVVVYKAAVAAGPQLTGHGGRDKTEGLGGGQAVPFIA